jgi:NAD(P)-dependent dehydrogenase (short-subunit alcohol dehydrogenase family)
MSTNILNGFDLSGRVALVTGASKGMGRCIAAILAQAGARVVISSRQQTDCERVAAEISPEPGQCIGIASDIGNSETLKTLVASTQSQIGNPTSWFAMPRGKRRSDRSKKWKRRSLTRR